MPEIMLAPDLHCYYANYGKVGPDGVHSRLAEWRQCANMMVDAAHCADIDIAVFPGDYFPNPRPSAAQIMEVARLFKALEDAGIAVIGCAGNHDVGASNLPGCVNLMDTMGGADGLWGITRPQAVTVADTDFVVLPFMRSAAVSADAEDMTDAADTMSRSLLAITQGLRAQSTSDTRVFVGHWTLVGAQTSSGQIMAGSGEPALPYSELAAMGFDAILMGHIHKPQVLSNAPFTAYAGALQRCDFGEERDPRGCWVWDSETREHEWIDLPARRFYTIDLRGDAAVQNWIERPGLTEGEAESVQDAVVRVRYRCSLDVALKVDTRDVRRKLLAAEPHHIAGINSDIIRGERARDASVTEATQPVEALQKYLAQRGDVVPERAEAVQRAAEGIIAELEKGVSA